MTDYLDTEEVHAAYLHWREYQYEQNPTTGLGWIEFIEFLFEPHVRGLFSGEGVASSVLIQKDTKAARKVALLAGPHWRSIMKAHEARK